MPRMMTIFLPMLAETAPVAAKASETAAAGTNWLGFLGHFHPLLLHLPIGLIAGVLLLEVAALWRAYHHGKHSGQVEWFEESRPYVGIAAWLLGASGAIAAAVGYFWRLDGERNGSLAMSADLHDHQVLGFWMAGGCVLVAILHAVAVRFKSRGLLWAFRVVLLVTAGLQAPVGHLGGQLVHGRTFLSENAPAWMPPFIKDLLGKAEVKGAKGEAKPGEKQKDESPYAVVVKPILDARCISCHGEQKQKGQLRLDGMEGIMKGGANSKGTLVVAGKPDESAMLLAIHAPLDDEEHMPPKAKPQPTQDEIAVLAWWISSGAKFDGKFDAATAPAEVKAVLANLPQAPGAVTAPAATGPDAPAVDLAAVSALRAKQVAIQPLAQGSNLLSVDFTASAANTHDAEMALIAPLSANIAQLNLGRSKITDAGLDAVAKLAKLETLDVRSSGVTDAGLPKLAGLKKLVSLNLTNTGITDAGLEKLAAIPTLTKVYLWGSKTTPEGVAKLKAALPKAVIDNGTTPDAVVVDTDKPVNALCPVTGAPINPAFTTSFQGKTIGFSSAEAKAKFEAAFKPAEAKPAEAKSVAAAVDPKPVNTVCPVSGKPVDPAHTVVFEGKTIGFCCPNCPKPFLANPAKYKDKLK